MSHANRFSLGMCIVISIGMLAFIVGMIHDACCDARRRGLGYWSPFTSLFAGLFVVVGIFGFAYLLGCGLDWLGVKL